MKKRLINFKKKILLLFLWAISICTYAQNITVTGIISDTEGEPLIGVTIQVQGTTHGTVTDFDGKYSVTDVPSDANLEVSYVGMQSQLISVDGRSVINITLQEDFGLLEEIVVVGYGVQKKETITGAVSSIQTSDIKQTSSASLGAALAGKLPGLISVQTGGGQPGRDDATLYLRGAATTNGTDPLILIDGVPRDNIRTIDPNEVATISILKDASATALFGVRGANGVILITTRRGEEGKMQLNVSTQQSFTSFTREPSYVSSSQFMGLRNQAQINDGNAIEYDELTMRRYANPLEGLDPNDPDYAEQARIRNYMYPSHDYYREYIAKHVPQTRVNISATGGTKQIGYFVNASYLHQGGNLKTEPKSQLGYDPSSWMDRYSFRANLDYDISNTLKAYLNLGAYIEKVNMPSAWLYEGDTNWMMRDLLYQAKTIAPWVQGPTTIEGYGVEPGQIVDPGYMDRSAFEVMNRMGFRNETRSNLNSSLGMEWDLSSLITEGLSVKGMVSYDTRATTAMQGQKSERLYIANVNPETNELSYATKREAEELLSITKGADSRYNINLQASLNYNRTFNQKHAVGGMILVQRDNWENPGADLPFNVVGLASRFTYAYDAKYLAEINMGYNGSEQFSPDKRFGFFPAFSAGWVVSNEPFLRDNNTITNLKLRASYGKVGNDKMGGTRFLYLDNITIGGGPLGSLSRGRGVNEGLLGNPNLTWEEAKKQNYGVDLQLFGNLTMAIDYFTEERSQILIERGMVPALQGVPLNFIPRINMGEVDNRGFEVELTYNKNLSRDLNMTVRGNFGYNKNKVKYMDEPKSLTLEEDPVNGYAYPYRRTGYSLGQGWGYKIDYSNGNGFFNSQEELDEYLETTTYGFGNPRVGDFKYVDVTGDGVVDDRDIVPLKYTSIPGITYGVTLGLDYKEFDFSVFFQGVGRFSSAPGAPQGVYEYTYRGSFYDYHMNAWTPERYANGDNITYPALSTHSNTNHVANDFFVMNRSFTRLKNLVFGYTLPANFLNQIGLENIRVYYSGENIFTWTPYKLEAHLDPEQNDPIGYPITKMHSIGFDITF